MSDDEWYESDEAYDRDMGPDGPAWWSLADLVDAGFFDD